MHPPRRGIVKAVNLATGKLLSAMALAEHLPREVDLAKPGHRRNQAGDLERSRGKNPLP
jgi:hypothetical protein